MKIIRHGYFEKTDEYTFICPHCGCIYEAKDVNDITNLRRLCWSMVIASNCPDCGTEVHNYAYSNETKKE